MMQEKIEANQVLKNLIHKCMLLTDRRGKVLSKESNPAVSRLRMEYRADGLRIWFGVSVSARAGGRYQMEVKENNKTVLEAEESLVGFYNQPYNPEVSVYTPGSWEDKISSIAVLERERLR